MIKKTKISILLVSALLVGILTSGFFLLPGVLGDEIYPLKYENLIVQYGEKYDVDPALVAAVIKQESNFNPNARSGAGAEGLAQFMRGTAGTMAKETGHGLKYNIYDPETSIEFCAAHLRDLLVKYNGNIDAALAGYNAGTGNADRWVRLGLLGNLPFGETRGYVVKVKNYYSIYLKLYGDNKLASTQTKVETVKVEVKKPNTYTAFWGMFFKDVFKINQPEVSGN